VFSTVSGRALAANLDLIVWRLKLLALFSILGALMLGCSGASGGQPKQAAVASPTPDSVTRNYVALVSGYWSDYKTAEGNGAHVCWGDQFNDVGLVNPPICRSRAVAMLAVHEKFLSDLDSTPPPPKFATDDRAFRSQLPKAIADVEAMISAADTGSKDAVFQATTVYVDDMIPIVTGALDDVDPSVVHN
jgi:hypothetical protein